MNYKAIYLVLGILIMMLAFIIAFFATLTFAAPTFQVPLSQDSYSYTTLLSATTTNATSTSLTNGGGYAVIAGAEHVNFYFSRGDTTGTGNAGSTRFSIQVSPNGQDWYDYGQLGTSTVGNTLESFATLTGTSTSHYDMDKLGYYAVRCNTVETIDGEATCKVGIDN